MIVGSVSASGHPVVGIKLEGHSGGVENELAIVDTGFNRFMTLPPEQIARLGIGFIGELHAVIAGKQIKDLQCYRGRIRWDGKSLSVPVLALEGNPLVGMAMLRGYWLEVDCSPEGAVRITRTC